MSNEAAGFTTATELGAGFVRCDVRELLACVAAVAAAEQHSGGLDLAFLNAAVAQSPSLAV